MMTCFIIACPWCLVVYHFVPWCLLWLKQNAFYACLLLYHATDACFIRSCLSWLLVDHIMPMMLTSVIISCPCCWHVIFLTVPDAQLFPFSCPMTINFLFENMPMKQSCVIRSCPCPLFTIIILMMMLSLFIIWCPWCWVVLLDNAHEAYLFCRIMPMVLALLSDHVHGASVSLSDHAHYNWFVFR